MGRLVGSWLFAAVLLLCPAAFPAAQRADLGSAERIADGVLLYRLDDESLIEPAGPTSVRALRLDPARVRLTIGLAEDRTPAREPVASMAKRRGAIAAVNGGFFALADGKPAGILKAGGRLIGRTARPRGAVAILSRGSRPRLLFDRVTARLANGRATYDTRLGSKPADWARAPDIVGGAGLLLRDGAEIDEWADEVLSSGFDTTRHPRTMIGVSDDEAIWLITVDGRQPALSLGMSFAELKSLARRLGLRSALNLDGGGSTTMVVNGDAIVNHPSDVTGPRAVSDAILVLPRK